VRLLSAPRGISTVLLIAHDYPPFTGSELSPAARWVESISRDGQAVEIIAPSDTEEEFVHLDSFGNLVHRIAAGRSYAFGVLDKLVPGFAARLESTRLRFAARAAEKIFERAKLWNRTILWSETLLSELALVAPAAAAALWQLREPALPPVQRRWEAQPAASIDLVICTYDRLDELIVSIDSGLAEVAAAREIGLSARLRVLYQNTDLPERLGALRPDLLPHASLSLELSAPPGLTRARNLALASSEADLVVFIDDDVKLAPGFLEAHASAARLHPEAIGFVGRIESPSEPVVGRPRAIGQVRPTGFVDVNYNSINRDAVYVPVTPMGANMAFRRERMNRLFGPAWFDAGLTGSAIREESTLALEICRAGEHLVFVPDAALEHFESERGGCNNRGRRSTRERIQHRSLESLFLARLYQGAGWLHAASALRAAIAEVRRAEGPFDKLEASAVHLIGYVGARRRFRPLARASRLTPVRAPAVALFGATAPLQAGQ